VPNEKKLLREQGADFGNAEIVTLGDHTYTIVPQRIGYLRSRLGTVFAGIVDLEVSNANLLTVLGDKIYVLLQVFIPDLMPEWEFHGYPTREAMEAEDYKEEYDHSPSPTEIREALTAGSAVNEIDLLKHLGKLIGPDLIRSWVAGAVADSMQATSQSSSLTSGESNGTPSPTSVPTPG
jgi:hypothetical protein